MRASSLGGPGDARNNMLGEASRPSGKHRFRLNIRAQSLGLPSGGHVPASRVT